MNLLERLEEQGLLTGAELREAEAAYRASGSGRPFDEWLVEQDRLSEEAWLRFLADTYRMPFLDDLGPCLDPSLVADLPVDWARQHCALPVQWAGEPVVVMANPAQASAADDASVLLRQDFGIALAPRAAILAAIDECYFRQSAEPTTGPEAEAAELETGEAAAAWSPDADDLLRSADQAPVIRFVNRMLLEAVRAGASDIHVEPYEKALRIRFRVDGFLREEKAPPRSLEAALVSRLKIMSRLDISERRLPQDGMAKVRVGDREIDIRVSTVPVAAGERVVLRILNQQTSLLPLDRLGMPEAIHRAFQRQLRQPGGILLVTGPTGSGKTTTLYSALRELDTGHLNILTIEDPVEYQLPDIGQIQVRPKLGLTFAEGLRHILRQDPDVILVGEIRDLETAEIAVRAALTGHLVFSTLHTNDAPSAVVRLMDLGIPPYLIGASLQAVLAQRLVRCVAGDTDGETGEPAYRGRTGIYEWFEMSDAAREALRTGTVTSGELHRLHEAQGGLTLRRDAEAKIRAGITTPDEVARVLGEAAGDPPA